MLNLPGTAASAVSAAQDAQAAAEAAAETANSVGCALNDAVEGASVYTPPSGMTCD